MHVISEVQPSSLKRSSCGKKSRIPTLLPNVSVEPVAWGWLAVLTLLAIGLRAIGLNQQLWYDEIITLLESARAPLWQIVTHYSGQNQHTLYSVLAHGSIRLLGEHAWTLRLPAAIFGVLCVPALYFFARQVTDNREALAACALMSLNPQHIWFSQNARGYTAATFWTLLASLFFLRTARSAERLDWGLYGLSAALGIYTHLMMVFVVAAHAVVYVVMLVAGKPAEPGRLRQRLSLAYGFVLCGIVSLILYAPVIPNIVSHTVGSTRDHVRYEWASPLWALAEVGRGLRSTTTGGWLALALGGGVMLCGLVSYWKQDRFVVGLMVLPGVMTAAGVLATSHNFWPRFFFFEIGFALLILARGVVLAGKFAARLVASSREAEIGLAFLALLLLASAVPLRAAYSCPKQDYLGAMAFVEQQRQSSDPIATAGAVSTPFHSYYGRDWPLIQTPAQLEQFVAGAPTAWLLYAMPGSIRSSQPELWQEIDSKFTVIRRFPGTLGGGDIYVSRSHDLKNRSDHAH